MSEPTKDLMRALAAANGLRISEERLDAVWREYQNFLRALAEIDKLALPQEAEPSITFSLAASQAVQPAGAQRR